MQLAESATAKSRIFTQAIPAEDEKSAEGGEKMNKTGETMMKTAAAGALIGTAAGAAISMSHQKTANIKKKTAKAMRTVGQTFESISRMM